MKASEYDKTNSYFRNEIINYENKCIDSGISIYFNKSFFYMIQMYSHKKNLIKLIERSDFSNNFKMQILLNKRNINSKKDEILKAKLDFEIVKNKLFNFLDTTKDPYYFILMPYYNFGSGINYKPIPYKKDNMSGIQNLHIAEDYANYLTKKPRFCPKVKII